MGPVQRRSVVVVSVVAAAAVVGLPLLAAARDGSPPVDAVETSVTDSTTIVDTSIVDTSTTVVDTSTSVVETTTSVANETTTTVPPPVIVAAAGDISCDPGASVTPAKCRAGSVSDALLALADLHAFLALGDLQYPDGTLKQFQQSYDVTFGRLKDRTYPAVGNHEYHTRDAAGYFDYFGDAAGTPGEGWYSFDVGTDWHFVALNSNCGDVSCDIGSAQEQWLRADLAASDRPCTAAFWHHPLFSSGDHHGSDPRTVPFWQALLDDEAELVLTGHDHAYERFAPQTADGTASELGLRQFVVGTGGKSLYSFADVPIANSEVRLVTFGYLRLSLDAGRYDFEFVGDDGTVLDSGSGTCHGPTPPTPSTTVPTASSTDPPASTVPAP